LPVLRSYQQEAVDTLMQVKRGTVKAATGTGKTIIAIEWIQQLGLDTLIIVPTQALIYQSWTPKLQDAGLLEVGQYYAYAKSSRPVVITTYSSAISHPELIERAGAVVLDEVHHLGARTALLRILPKLKDKEYVLGLSAVPERGDMTHELFLKEFPICFDLGLGEAVKSGFVSPLTIHTVEAAMTTRERKSYEVNTALINKAFKFCGPSLASWMSCYDVKTSQHVGRKGIQAIMRRKKLLSRIETKKRRVLEILLQHRNERVLVFSESVQGIEEIKEFLSERGIRSETFHSRVEPWRRMEILQDWGKSFFLLERWKRGWTSRR
jgi:superfamily II DNA or RNA helicase